MIDKGLSVTQVNHFIKTLVESNSVLKRITVTGEISGFTRQSSGHLYFSLKDDNSRISCVCFKGNAQDLTVKPQDGMAVIIHGNLSVYEKNGQYQLVVRTMERAGLGDLYLEYEALKKRLQNKGWFDAAAKKPLPETIERVGVVTSPTGAAIHDIISVIGRRNPFISIVLYPAQVQGEGAAMTIGAGIEKLCELETVDVIIVGRGGGSMEDLWHFNEERVAEAIHFAHIPIISAVGHETDFTIADFVADFRAPTPSVAAEMVAQDMVKVGENLKDTKNRIARATMTQLSQGSIVLTGLSRRVKNANPIHHIEGDRLALDQARGRIIRALTQRLALYEKSLLGYKKQLALINPQGVLEKGYALVYNQDGKVITRAVGLHPNEPLTLAFADGRVSVVTEKEEENGR